MLFCTQHLHVLCCQCPTNSSQIAIRHPLDERDAIQRFILLTCLLLVQMYHTLNALGLQRYG